MFHSIKLLEVFFLCFCLYFTNQKYRAYFVGFFLWYSNRKECDRKIILIVSTWHLFCKNWKLKDINMPLKHFLNRIRIQLPICITFHFIVTVTPISYSIVKWVGIILLWLQSSKESFWNNDFEFQKTFGQEPVTLAVLWYASKL